MKYFYIITVAGGTKGNFTKADVITAESHDNRMSLFVRIYTDAVKLKGWDVAETGITYFYLEPLEL